MAEIFWFLQKIIESRNEISEEDIMLYGDVIKKNPLNLVEVISTVITHATNLLTKAKSKDKAETSQEDQAKVLSQVQTQLDESTKQELIKILSKD